MELAWDWYQAAGVVSTCGLCVCRGWNHFFLLSLHCDKVEMCRAGTAQKSDSGEAIVIILV